METPLFEGLRARLAARTPGPPEPIPAWVRASLRPAAVLLPLYANAAGEVRAVFTQRAADLRDHAGQVAFPGGAVAPDDRDRVATALREAFEEVGLRGEDCEVLGTLDPTLVPTGFEITPVVARIPAGYRFVPSATEVARIFDLPLSGFLRPGALEVRAREVFGKSHRVLYYRVAGEEVWGATARIVEQLLFCVAPLLQEAPADAPPPR